MSFRTVIFFIFLGFHPCMICERAGARDAAGQAPPRVLLLYSNDRLLPANLRFDEGFRETLGQAFGERYELYAEFLDAVRFPGEERQEAMAEALRVRYEERPPQVLVAGGPEALGFFLSRRDSLFPGTPLVFGGMRLRDKPDFKPGANVTGVPMSLEIAPTLDMALRLRPQTREVVVVSGSAKIDREWDELARVEFKPFESRVKVTYWNDLPFAELLARAGRLSPDTTVFFLTYFKEPDGSPLSSSAQAVERFAEKCPAPVFGPYDTYPGRGIVGGMMSDFNGEGAATAGLVRRILAGESPQDIGIQPPRPGGFRFDARELQRRGISESALPAGSTVLFRTPGLWETHRTAVLLTLAVITIQTGLLVLLFAARRRARETDASLSFAADAAHVGLWQRDLASDEVTASPRWRALFDLPASGRLTLDDVLARVHPADAPGMREAIERGARDGRGYDLEHRIVLPDGSVRWIVSVGRADGKNGGSFFRTRGVSMDVSGRKRIEAELDEQRRELAHLSRVTMLSALSESLAHELNQPLGIILSNAQAAEALLEDDAPDLDELRSILADIVKADRRAGEVIKRLRAFLKRGEANRQAHDINETVEETLQLVRSDLIGRGVTVECSFAPGLPPVRCDRVQLQQVILNLLMNACDAMTGNESYARQIKVDTTRGEGGVRVSVRDSGCGLPPDIEDTLMNPHLLTTAFVIASLPAFAGNPSPVVEPTLFTAAEPSEWAVRVALYGWAQSLDGDIAIAGNSAPVDVGFDDILDNLDIAVMGSVEIGRGRWSFVADMNYAEVSSGGTTAGGIEVDAEQDQFLGNFTVAYQAVTNDCVRFDIYAGARVNSVRLSLDLDNPATPGTDFSGADRKTWVDPIVGVRFQAELSDRIFFRAVGDIGGFGVSSDLTWQAMAGFGYRFTDGCSGLLGYRGIGTDYSDGGFAYDVTAHGPAIGLEFRF